MTNYHNSKQTVLSVNSFDADIVFNEGVAIIDGVTSEIHCHDKCEIYINISGNVSFRVENRVYSIKSGDVIITKPYEYHHCIYHSTESHDHYCINFSPDGNKELFNLFFERKNGEGNLISLSGHKRTAFLNCCKLLVESDNQLKRHIAFFNIIDLLSDEKFSTSYKTLPTDVKAAIDFIESNISSAITIDDLAQHAHVTANTLSRHFKKSVGISPYSYVQNMRLANALSMLKQGYNVTQTSILCGFSDYSHFIALFKKKYGKTPLKLQKELE